MKNKTIFRRKNQIYIKKSLIILITLLIAIGSIGYSGTKLLNEITAIDSVKVSKHTKLAGKVVKSNPVKLQNIVEPQPNTEYEIIGVKLNSNQKKVANEIIKIAKKEDFKWIPYLIELSWCESKLGEIQINDKGNTPPSRDRGYFQINDYWHKDITDKQAFDLEFATKWTMNMINKGYQHRWACDKIVRTNNIKIELKNTN